MPHSIATCPPAVTPVNLAVYMTVPVVHSDFRQEGGLLWPGTDAQESTREDSMWNPDQVYAGEQVRRAELYAEAERRRAGQMRQAGASARLKERWPIVVRLASAMRFGSRSRLSRFASTRTK
jgi:hypothetical protein